MSSNTRCFPYSETPTFAPSRVWTGAADFFTVEVWTRRGLQRFVVLFFIELCTRRVEIAGVDSSVNGLWMSQIGRNLTDAVDGILRGKRYLIHDRDPLFTDETTPSWVR